MIPRMTGFLSGGNKTKTPCEGVLANVGGERLAEGEMHAAPVQTKPPSRAKVPLLIEG
jgi:hypothetical protein